MGQCEHSAHTSPFMTVIIHTLNSTFSTAFIQSHNLFTMFDSADQSLFEGRNPLIFSEELRCCISLELCYLFLFIHACFYVYFYLTRKKNSILILI